MCEVYFFSVLVVIYRPAVQSLILNNVQLRELFRIVMNVGHAGQAELWLCVTFIFKKSRQKQNVHKVNKFSETFKFFGSQSKVPPCFIVILTARFLPSQVISERPQLPVTSLF